MWIRELAGCLLGLIFGGGVAAGTVALVTSIGIFPRIVGKTTTAGHILLYETLLLAGAFLGSLVDIFELEFFSGRWILVLSGVFSGIFTGCLSAALAEVIQVWPVLYRRIGVEDGRNPAMTFFALGKLAGGLYYFLLLKYHV